MRYFRFALASFLCGSALALAACGSEPADAQLGLSGTAHAATVDASAPASLANASGNEGFTLEPGDEVTYGRGMHCFKVGVDYRTYKENGESVDPALAQEMRKCNYFASRSSTAPG